jgi:dethiobiotin synthetase
MDEQERAASRGGTRGGRHWVVLGAGTGVGKTFVSTTLARLLALRGAPVAAVKPIESGIAAPLQEGAPPPPGSDAAALEAASFHVKRLRRHPLLGLVAPLTPSLAARREGKQVDLSALEPWLSELEATEGGVVAEVVVETAGGVFSPLNAKESNLDLAVALEPAIWVLVASDRLGVLHELGATLRAMAASARLPDWLVLSAPALADDSTGTNAAELEAMGFGVPIVCLGRNEQAPLGRVLGSAAVQRSS